MVRGVGGPIGIRAAVAAGAAGSSNVQNEIAQMQRDQIHLLVGTPAKICEVMTARGGLGGGEVRLLIVRPQLFHYLFFFVLVADCETNKTKLA